MADEAFNNVHLIGTDGGDVPCCKVTMAMASPVFKSMFFQGFKEETTDQCSLDFHSVVISVLVKYCYCGEVDLDLIFTKDQSLEQEACLLVGLREAGIYFELEDLKSAAEAKIAHLVFQYNTTDKRKYQYAPVFLTELYKRDEDQKEPLWFAVCELAGKNAMECFGPRVHEDNSIDTYHAHPTVLSRALEQNQDAYAVVRCLQTWFSIESKSGENGYTDEEKLPLIKIAENINLNTLSTKQLSNIEPCSLFSNDRILKAFVHHCKDNGIVTEAQKKDCWLHLFGAGMEHLNGAYQPYKYGFCKDAEYDGLPCWSLIHRKHTAGKWLISISKDKTNFNTNADNEICDDFFRLHVYESLCQSIPTNDPIPPVNGWKSIEGTGPVPIVAFIDQQSPIPAK